MREEKAISGGDEDLAMVENHELPIEVENGKDSDFPAFPILDTEKVYFIVICVENITIECLCFECTMFKTIPRKFPSYTWTVSCHLHLSSKKGI